MTEKYLEDGETYTEEWKTELCKHPIILDIFSHLIKTNKGSAAPSQKTESELDKIYEEFFRNISNAAKKFHELGATALEEGATVQDGLNLMTSMLYQLFPGVNAQRDRIETYKIVNQMFWGEYFYHHGVDGAQRAGRTDDLSIWQIAKMFAEDYWKFGEQEFMPTIALGVAFVEKHIQGNLEPQQKLDLICNLLDRFGYSEDAKNGYMFFLGGSILVPRSKDDIENLQIAREQISKFDINEEYEQLLGPLRDIYLQRHFEEFVWRLGVDLEPRKIPIPNSDVEVSEFEFKNHKTLDETDTKIETYFEREDFLNRMLVGIGKELSSNDYDLRQSFKAGICFFNVKAQVDAECTTELLRVVNGSLTPIIDFITMVGRSPTEVSDGYLDIQISLYTIIRVHSHEFCQVLWGFQSFVFYKDQKEITGVPELSIPEFREHCREMVIKYLSVTDLALLQSVVDKKEHLDMFPRIASDTDERESFDVAFRDAFGQMKPEGYHGDVHVKSLIIYSYFNVICETILSSPEQVTIQ